MSAAYPNQGPLSDDMIWALLQSWSIRNYSRSSKALYCYGLLSKRNGSLTKKGKRLRKEYQVLWGFVTAVNSVRGHAGLEPNRPGWMDQMSPRR